MKAKKGKKCRISGIKGRVTIVRVRGNNVIVRLKNGRVKATNIKNLYRWKILNWIIC